MRPQAGSATIIALEESGPRLGQAEQAQGVPRGRRVEDDVIVGSGVARQERRKLIEGGDLGRAGTGQLFAHRREFLGAGTRADLRQNPLAVGLGCVVGVDVQHRQAGRAGHRHRCVAKFNAEHLVQIRRRVGADQQHLLAGIRQAHCNCGRQRGLADPALAGEKQKSGRVLHESDVARPLRQRRTEDDRVSSQKLSVWSDMAGFTRTHRLVLELDAEQVLRPNSE